MCTHTPVSPINIGVTHAHAPSSQHTCLVLLKKTSLTLRKQDLSRPYLLFAILPPPCPLPLRNTIWRRGVRIPETAENGRFGIRFNAHCATSRLCAWDICTYIYWYIHMCVYTSWLTPLCDTLLECVRHIYIYVHIYIYIYVYTYIYIYINIYIHIFIYVYICIYIHIYSLPIVRQPRCVRETYIHIYVYIHMYVLSLYICICICICTYLYYMRGYIYKHTYMYI